MSKTKNMTPEQARVWQDKRNAYHRDWVAKRRVEKPDTYKAENKKYNRRQYLRKGQVVEEERAKTYRGDFLAAKNRMQRWDPIEESLVMAGDMNAAELSPRIGRSICAIWARQRLLKKQNELSPEL